MFGSFLFLFKINISLTFLIFKQLPKYHISYTRALLLSVIHYPRKHACLRGKGRGL